MEPVIRSATLPTGMTLPYVKQGDTSGVPVLLLHGFAGTWHGFEPVLAHLPASIHAVALTQRGHGDASKPAGGHHLDDFGADLDAFMHVLEMDQAVVVGHSMGGAVAQRFAIDHPERMLGLVLMGASMTEPNDPELQAFWESTVSQLSDAIDPDFVRRFLESTLAQPVPQAFFERLLQRSLKVPARVWKAAWLGRLEEDLSDELGEIEAPTLIVWGDQDVRCTREDQEQLLKAVPDSRLVVYPGAGHSFHYEEPERFASDLMTFIQDHVS
jgi:pimeloyl-ACP methyl ester carboxylesterase